MWQSGSIAQPKLSNLTQVSRVSSHLSMLSFCSAMLTNNGSQCQQVLSIWRSTQVSLNFDCKVSGSLEFPWDLKGGRKGRRGRKNLFIAIGKSEQREQKCWKTPLFAASETTKKTNVWRKCNSFQSLCTSTFSFFSKRSRGCLKASARVQKRAKTDNCLDRKMLLKMPCSSIK